MIFELESVFFYFHSSTKSLVFREYTGISFRDYRKNPKQQFWHHSNRGRKLREEKSNTQMKYGEAGGGVAVSFQFLT